MSERIGRGKNSEVYGQEALYTIEDLFDNKPSKAIAYLFSANEPKNICLINFVSWVNKFYW